MTLKMTALAAAVAGALSAPLHSALAAYDYALGSVFTLHILQKGDSYVADDETLNATYDLNQDYLSAFSHAADYWLSVFGTAVEAEHPVRILVQAKEEADGNAGAGSGPISAGGSRTYAGVTQLSAALFYNYFGENGTSVDDEMAVVQVDRALLSPYGYDWDEGALSSVPNTGFRTSLSAVLAHEFAHALGLLYAGESEGKTTYTVNMTGKFAQGIKDSRGVAFTEGAVFITEENYNRLTDAEKKAGKFAVMLTNTSFSGMYFTSSNTDEVLNGARIAWVDSGGAYTVPGVPVNGFEGSGPDVSHLELQNGLMSHHMYRNYSVLMEAELAVLQDTGVPMDRKNLYGFSIYNSGNAAARRNVVNTNPYYARTASGEWIAGTPNATAYGTGLHVYGSYNDVVQAADLLSSGNCGIGIRVDGVQNRIAVPAGTTVRADGTGGVGIWFAWGKGHNLDVAGTVTAAGSGGNAVEFNFGDNTLGNQFGYRGSYIEKDPVYETLGAATSLERMKDSTELADELRGALVDNFNLSGTLQGANNAVYISPNAYVRRINFLTGSRVSGNITSDWNYAAGFLHAAGNSASMPLLTDLNFGVKTDGTALQADENFTLDFDGSINGASSFVVNFEGGTVNLGLGTEAGSTLSALALKVASNAVLNAKGTVTLSALSHADSIAEESGFYGTDFGTFTNGGTVAVAGGDVGTLTVTGSFTQTESGTLLLQVGHTDTDVLDVSGNLTLAGTVRLAPAKEYYADEFFRTVTLSDLVGADSVSSDVEVLAAEHVSPTLAFTVEAAQTRAASGYTVTLTRQDNAYSQYAFGDGNTEAVAAMFDRVASDASSNLQNGVATLDFSASDGSGVRAAMSSITPIVYGNVVNGILSHQRFLTDRMLDRMQRTEQTGTRVYADSYATYGSRGRGLYKVNREENFGLVVGADAAGEAGLAGLYLNLNERHQKSSGASKAVDRSIAVGAHGAWNLNPERTLKLIGDAHTGFDFVKANRYVNLAGYREGPESDFTAWTAGLTGAVGYDIPMQGGLTVHLLSDLTYSHVRVPSVRETGAELALRLQHNSFSSLLAGAGVGVTLPEIALESEASLSLKGALRYQRELLGEAGRYTASFRHYEGTDFRQTVNFQGKNRFYATAGADYRTESIAIEVNLGGAFYGGEGQELFAKAAFTWKF